MPLRSLRSMNSLIATPENQTFAVILEGLLDAVLISNIQGEVLYSNLCAQKLCRQLNLKQLNHHALWSLCELLQSQSNRDLILESELMIAENQYRIRVQWLNVSEEAKDDRLIIRIENQRHSMQCAAIFEAECFGLTQREAEVWELRKQDRSRREIADQLYISIDTVKKHLANIQIKRQNYIAQSN
jgi:DNA-binding CsgD family transcriptional regulator